jgi:excisionase family DNA binding protein
LPGCGDPLLTKQQVAFVLATTPRHIERLVEDGRLGYCRVGRFIRFTTGDIARYLQRARVAATTAEQSTKRCGGSR